MPLRAGQLEPVERRAEYSEPEPLGWVERLGQRAVGSVCGKQFEVSASTREVLRNFVIRYKEERTLAGTDAPPAPPPPTQEP